MNRAAYYEQLKDLARGIRAEFGLVTPRVLLSDLRRIYKQQGLSCHLWPPPRTSGRTLKVLRGAIVFDEGGPGAGVMVSRKLPEEQRIFTMAHELKHFHTDRELGSSLCSSRNASDAVEIGAEIFAAELIFPDTDFSAEMAQRGIQPGACRPRDLVILKHETRATLSFAGLVKKAEFLGFCEHGSMSGTKWRALEREVYGVPFYLKLPRSK